MQKRFDIGDLVRFQYPRTRRPALYPECYVRKHMPWNYEIGIVIANDCVQGCVVSFPSRITPVSTLNLKVL